MLKVKNLRNFRFYEIAKGFAGPNKINLRNMWPVFLVDTHKHRGTIKINMGNICVTILIRSFVHTHNVTWSQMFKYLFC
jgi:hypothetical protein